MRLFKSLWDLPQIRSILTGLVEFGHFPLWHGALYLKFKLYQKHLKTSEIKEFCIQTLIHLYCESFLTIHSFQVEGGFYSYANRFYTTFCVTKYPSYTRSYKVNKLKGIIWDCRWSPPSIRIFSHKCWFCLQKCISNHETKQASKFPSDPSSNCFTINVW